MIKTILAPTDFSDNAYSATRYACKLALQNNLNIELFHCYTTSSTVFENEKEESPLLKANVLIEQWKDNLLKDFPSLHIKTTCISGLISEVIPTMTKEGNYALVVMGTTGEGKGKSITWGSNTSAIVEKSSIPVFAIPIHHDEFKFDHIATLTNFKSEELETLSDFTHLIHEIPHLDIIHIYKNSDIELEVAEKLKTWVFNIQEINGIDQVDIVSQTLDYSNENIDTISEVIQEVISKQNYDIIVVSKTRKNLFERLFSFSISKEMALNITKPTFFDNN